MQSRGDLFERYGGDTVQMERTRAQLKELGVRVDISVELEPDLTDYDLVHLFNIARVQETHLQYLNARGQGKPIALSPIYQDLKEYNRRGRYGLAKVVHTLIRDEELTEYAKNIFRRFSNPRQKKILKLQRRVGYRDQQKEVLNQVDVLLPNSRMEMDRIETDFGVKNRYRVIPNGVEMALVDASPDDFVTRYALRDFVLCAGRIESLKNQLSLIRALRNSGLTLILVGEINPYHKLYGKRVLREVRKSRNVFYFSGLVQKELASAYAAARVYVQPSWFETTGLASLEAGLAGCNVVTTDRGYTKEYFKNYAWYCDPADIFSIRDTVLEAYDSPKRGELRKRILQNYTWNRAAEETLKVYQEILER